MSSTLAAAGAPPPPVILCTGGYDHTIKFWDLLTGQCTATIQHLPSHINCMRLSSNKRLLAIGSLSQVKVFDARSVWMSESESELLQPPLSTHSAQTQPPLPQSPEYLSNLAPLWILDSAPNTNVVFLEFIKIVDNCYYLWVVSDDGSLKEWRLPLPADCLTTTTSEKLTPSTAPQQQQPSRPSSPTIAQHPSTGSILEDSFVEGEEEYSYMATSTLTLNLLSQTPQKTPEKVILTPAGQTYPPPLLCSFAFIDKKEKSFVIGDSWGRIRYFGDPSHCLQQRIPSSTLKAIQSISTQDTYCIANTEEELFFFQICDSSISFLSKQPLPSKGIRAIFSPIASNDDRKTFVVGTQDGQVLIYHLFVCSGSGSGGCFDGCNNNNNNNNKNNNNNNNENNNNNNNITIELVHRLRGHQRWVWDLQFSADGAYLFTASSDRSARLWDVSHWTKGTSRVDGSGRCLVQYKGHMKACIALALNDHPS